MNQEENSCEYKLDLSQFYYDSSLQHERERIFSFLNKNEIICNFINSSKFFQLKGDIFGSSLMSIQFLKRDFRTIINTNGNYNLFKSIRENMALNKIDDTNILLLNINLIDFFKNILIMPFKSSSDFFKNVYIDIFIKDLSFLSQ